MRLGDRGAVRAVGAPNLRIWVCRPRGAGCARLFPLLAAQNRPPQSRGRSMTAATWTAERIEQLRNFVVTGLTCSQIAAEIGVTRNAVIGKIHRLGLSGPGAAARLRRAERPVTPRRPLRRGYFAFGTRQRNGVAFHLMLLRTGP